MRTTISCAWAPNLGSRDCGRSAGGAASWTLSVWSLSIRNTFEIGPSCWISGFCFGPFPPSLVDAAPSEAIQLATGLHRAVRLEIGARDPPRLQGQAGRPHFLISPSDPCEKFHILIRARLLQMCNSDARSKVPRRRPIRKHNDNTIYYNELAI